MADGWIEWNGGECPVDPGARVQIAFRAGGTRTRKADNCRWKHSDDARGGYDIVAYRPARMIQHRRL